MYLPILFTFLASSLWVAVTEAAGPFLKTVSEFEHIIGNDHWNITIGRQYGTKLYYKDHDLVGDAWGHYVSYSTFYQAWYQRSEEAKMYSNRWSGIGSQLDLCQSTPGNRKLPGCQL
jgi:hypothetical protein